MKFWVNGHEFNLFGADDDFDLWVTQSGIDWLIEFFKTPHEDQQAAIEYVRGLEKL